MDNTIEVELEAEGVKYLAFLDKENNSVRIMMEKPPVRGYIVAGYGVFEDGELCDCDADIPEEVYQELEGLLVYRELELLRGAE